MSGADLLATIIEAVVGIILLTAWIVFAFYLVKKWKRRNIDPGPLIPPDFYGAWQGHNLGTTTMEPGELTRIEHDLEHPAGERKD